MRKPNIYRNEMGVTAEIYEGQSVERYIEQAETSKQPIEGGAPIIFTPRKDGVKAEYNIRTDRWELAQKAMNKVAGTYQAKRDEWIKSQETAETAEGAA